MTTTTFEEVLAWLAQNAPGILTALVVLVVGWQVAKLASRLVERQSRRRRR